MAVPTITSVTPATGPAAGSNLVDIIGTNFNTPTAAMTLPTPDLSATVAVTMGGLSPIKTMVISSTRIRVLMPRYRGSPAIRPFPPISVTVQNLDTDGAAVPGEQATLANAYTYTPWHPGLPRKHPPMVGVILELLDRLQTEVCPNVYFNTHFDFGEDGESGIAIAEVPSVNIEFSFPRDAEWSQWDNAPVLIERTDGQSYDQYYPTKTYMAVGTLYLAGETQLEALHLCANIQDFVDVNPLLPVALDADVYGVGEDDFALEIWQDPKPAKSRGSSPIVVYTMELRVRGIPVITEEPIARIHNVLEFLLVSMGLNDTQDPISHTI